MNSTMDARFEFTSIQYLLSIECKRFFTSYVPYNAKIQRETVILFTIISSNGGDNMGIAEVLTVIFIVLKITEVITWSWWLVLLPAIISFSIYVLILLVKLGVIMVTVVAMKKRKE
ncbi:hypothetical protein [Lysinibacillus sphaericus]|uniref:hypothetical protein n=1 Tax=Lysinibacillus sphaericus TaxID=1421 RepID=UPI003D7FD559